MSLHDMPSIGTATGSRVDSAAKHIMACKVDSRLLGRWLENPNSSDPTSYMHTNKMKFCMHKDEIVLNTTKKKNNQDTSAKAYHMVVSTVGEMQKLTQFYIEYLYSCATDRDFFNVLDRGENVFATSTTAGVEIPPELNDGIKQIALEQIRHLPERVMVVVLKTARNCPANARKEMTLWTRECSAQAVATANRWG